MRTCCPLATVALRWALSWAMGEFIEQTIAKTGKDARFICISCPLSSILKARPSDKQGQFRAEVFAAWAGRRSEPAAQWLA
jgi:hypothetical protein